VTYIEFYPFKIQMSYFTPMCQQLVRIYPFFTARCYASAVYAVVVCPSVHLSQVGSSVKTATG